MTIYIVAIATSILITWIGVRTTAYKNGKRHWILPILAALPLILVIGLRHYSIGIDSPAYYRGFYRIKDSGISGNFEWLYVLLNRAVGYLGGEYTTLFLACGAIFCIPVFRQIFDDSPDILMSVFLFCACRYYFACFNLLRQLISCSILLFSIRYIEKKRFYRFLACVVIAGGFHSSAYAFAILYVLAGIRIEPKVIVIGTVVALILGRIPAVSTIISTMQGTRYEGYAMSEGNSFSGVFLTFLVFTVILIVALMFYEDNRKYRIYLNSQILAVWATSMTGEVALVERMRFTFGLPSIILLPMAIHNIRDKRVQTLVRFGTVVGFAIYGYLCLKNNLYNMVPYRAYNG